LRVSSTSSIAADGAGGETFWAERLARNPRTAAPVRRMPVTMRSDDQRGRAS
jgi:hypothetical protein